ncbi:MAG: hypothetical protein ACE5F9_07595, partial [Phycisphaerae bacterium]
PTPDTAVAASMANFLWNRGTTTASYFGIGNPKAGKPRAVPGLVFPDFSGIAVVDPTIIAQAPSGGAEAVSNTALIQSVIAIILLDQCHRDCIDTFMNAVAACQSQHATAVQQCNDLYGPDPGPPPHPGDPTQLAFCLNVANSDNLNCLATAAHVYNNCILLCDRNTTVQ